MKRVLTLLLILTLTVGNIIGLFATSVAARVHSVQPTNEDGGPPTDQFTTADPIFAIFRADVEGGKICVVPEDNPEEKSHCKTIANYVGTGWWLIAPGLPAGRYRLLAYDPGYSFLSVPFEVANCTAPDCAARRQMSDEVVAEWKRTAGEQIERLDTIHRFTEIGDIGDALHRAHTGHGIVKEITRLDMKGWQAEAVAVAGGVGLGFTVFALSSFGIPTNEFTAYLILAREVTEGTIRMYEDIKKDPPDYNYTTVATPAFEEWPSTGNALHDRVVRTLERQRAFGRAQLKAYERYLGAMTDGQDTYVRLQAQAVADYGYALAAEMKESAAAMREWGAQLDPNVPAVTQQHLDETAAIYDRVRASGFTQDEINQLTAAGISAGEIEQVRAAFNEDIRQTPVGVSMHDALAQTADTLEAGIPAVLTFSREAAWVADGRAPKTISLAPASASLSVSTTHTISASVTNARNEPVAGVLVTLDVTGANPSSLTATTNAGGVATFSYVGNNPGVDNLSATAGTVTSNTATASWSIEPPNAAPSVRGYDTFTEEGSNGGFEFNFTDADAQDTHTVTIDWGDGSPVSTFPNPNGNSGVFIDNSNSGFVIGFHRYIESGVYKAMATVTDNHGGIGTATAMMTVNNAAPIVSAITPANLNGTVTVSANFVDVGIKDTHTAIWEWGDGTTSAATVTEANGSGSVGGNHAYPAPGIYTIKLVVSDNDGGTGSRSIGLTIDNGGLSNTPPSIQPSNQSTYEGGGQLNFQFTDPDTGDTHTATIDWGDGEPSSRADIYEGNGSGTAAANHSYVDNGTYNATVTVADNHGGSDTKVVTITVFNSEPRVSRVARSSSLITLGSAVTVSANFVDVGIKDTHTAIWEWGDGTTSAATVMEANGSGSVGGDHVYNVEGVYTITLTVRDDDGDSGVNNSEQVGVYTARITAGSIQPVVTETGRISVSINGRGTTDDTDVIRIKKPHGATVRKAYLAVATTGFQQYLLRPGEIKLENVAPVWEIVAPNSILAYNYWADVTEIAKTKLNSAPDGIVDFAYTEMETYHIDGAVLVVIFDDLNEIKDNTVALLFGAQQTQGDKFALRFAQPVDMSDPNFLFTMSLGISFGYQGTVNNQYSIVDVNGQRMTTSAGGEDDGQAANGALLTVGGLGDDPANPPDPQALPVAGPRSDDELYDLKPFVKTGDISLTVNTQNPSNDDNIFFSAFFIKNTAAVVGEGVVLAPVSATNQVGSQHTVTATAQDALGNLIAGRNLNFEVISGPHAGLTYTVATDAQGRAQFTYTGTKSGTDDIVTRFVDSTGQTQTSNTVTATWDAPTISPTILNVGPATGTYGGTIELSSTLTADGTSLSDKTVSFSLNGMGLGVAKTNNEGIAKLSNINLAGINAGTHENVITASFAGDSSYAASSGTANLTVSKATLTVTAANASRKYGEPNPMFSGTITGIKNGDEITASYSTAATLASNVGTYDILPTLTDPTGKLSNYDVTQIKGTLTVTKAALSVVADDVSKVYGTNNPPLTVHYSGFVNGEDTSVLGGSLRLSTTAMTGSPVSSYPIEASGLTASNYTITFVNGKLIVTKAVLTITADNKSRIYNMVNPPLTFTSSGFVNGDTAATAFTGAPILTTAAQTGGDVGAYPITAAIGTLSSANYSFKFVLGTLTVNRAPTTTVTDGQMFANNGVGILTASLLDINSLPIVNRRLTLRLGTGASAQMCSATTDAAGKASCRINTVVQPLGPGTISSSFAGDNNYLPSGNNAQTLIFDYPAGVAGGSFVISDRNAVVGKQVTFWGAQWANLNPLGGGAAPSSFKGFANQTSTNPATCGGKWTTGPGNSSGPPSSIPAYMAVIVSSSITKSGSIIEGNVSQIVIVKTNPGYDSNPGRAGTGTVVAVWCH